MPSTPRRWFTAHPRAAALAGTTHEESSPSWTSTDSKVSTVDEYGVRKSVDGYRMGEDTVDKGIPMQLAKDTG
eukprot:gene6041-4342_t